MVERWLVRVECHSPIHARKENNEKHLLGVPRREGATVQQMNLFIYMGEESWSNQWKKRMKKNGVRVMVGRGADSHRLLCSLVPTMGCLSKPLCKCLLYNATHKLSRFKALRFQRISCVDIRKWAPSLEAIFLYGPQ